MLVGWWAAALVSGVIEGHAVGATAARLVQRGPSPRLTDRLPVPALPHPRALRQARGIGRRRSVDLARFLWEHGPEAPIETLPGFGPKTAAAARLVLQELQRCP